MPFEDVDPNIIGQRPVAPLAVEREVDTATVVKGFVEQEGIIPNLAELLVYGNAFEDEDGYDAFEDMQGYEGYADELNDVKSREEMVYRKRRIDDRNLNMQNFAEADGLQKALAIGAFVATDPTVMIPVGGATYKTYRTGGRILEGGVKTAGIASAVEVGREALLQYNQDTRTTEESLMNVGAAGVVGGLLGSASAGLSQAQVDDIVRRYADEMITPEANPTAGVSTVGAAQTGTSLIDEEIKGLNRTKKVFNKVPSFLKNPVWDGATSNSLEMRKITEQLSDLSLVKNKNTQGIATEQSVELGVKMYDTLRVPFYRDYNDAWKAYTQRAKAGLPIDERIGSHKTGRMTRTEFDEAIGYAMRRNDEHIIPEVAQAAQSARKNVFDPILKRAEEVGVFKNIDELDVQTAPSWLKRVYDVDKIQANRIEFKGRLTNWLKQQRELAEEGTRRATRLDEEIDQLAEEIIDRITNVTQGRIPYDLPVEGAEKGPKKVGVRGSAKQRVFAIPDKDIEDFLVSDINVVMDSHIRTMAPDNELLAKFETLDVDVLKQRIQEDYIRMRGAIEKDAALDLAQKNKKLQELEKELAKDIKNTEAMWDKLRGMYALPDDYSAPAHVMERTGMAWNFVRLLGDVVASSIPDMGRHVMVHGFNRSYGDLISTVISDIKGLKLAVGDVTEIGTAIDLTNSMTALRRANMDEYMPVTSKVDDLSQKVSTGTATLTGINHWNAIQKTFAGVMTQNRMLKAIQDLGAGKKIGQKELENLASHGIDPAMAKRIAKQFDIHGETRKVLRIANARDWDDAVAKQTFRAAVRKQVDEIIITPGLDRPLWLSRPGWRTIGQFKSFSFSSMQRVTMAGLQQADANVMAGLTTSVLLGSMVYAYKAKMRGATPSDDPRVWITEGIDRSGVAGWFFDINNMVEKATRGRVGVNALIGGPPMSRYASRNVTGALLGPSFGAAQDIFQVTGALSSGEISPSDTHAARRLLPGQNIPYLRGMFDQLEAGVNNTLGVRD